MDHFCKIALATTISVLFLSQDVASQQAVVESAIAQINLMHDAESKTVTVTNSGKMFTQFQYGDTAKPYLHPVLGPKQIRMTRDFPIKATAGEADDHPHHKSIWIGHEINGIDFWTNKGGRIEVADLVSIDDDSNGFTVNNRWIDNDDEVICSDSTRWSFGANENSRWIDCEFRLTASVDAITINDTKEGTVAIRTHPDLRLKTDPRRGVERVFGNATNSNGTSGVDVWGQSSSWVAYSGTIESNPASILIIDHPSNFRHPTTWHAREYGLIAANPFGLSAFQGLEHEAGQVVLAKGQSLTLKYRFIFFDAEITVADADRERQIFSATPE